MSKYIYGRMLVATILVAACSIQVSFLSAMSQTHGSGASQLQAPQSTSGAAAESVSPSFVTERYRRYFGHHLNGLLRQANTTSRSATNQLGARPAQPIEQIRHSFLIGASTEVYDVGKTDNQLTAPVSAVTAESSLAGTREMKQSEGKLAQVAHYSMHQGSMLVYHNTSVLLQAGNSTINVARGVVAYVVALGNDLAIFNLSGIGAHSVEVTIGSRSFDVPINKALIMSQTAADFSRCQLAQLGDCANPVNLGSEGATSLFQCCFSVVEVLNNSPQFQQFIKSKDKVEHKTATLLLKIGAAAE